MALKTYQGSCHCGAVEFEVTADLQSGTIRCNCSICRMSRMWLAFVPINQFRLLSGEENLIDYMFGAKSIRHRFCRTCGIKPFGMAVDGSGVAVHIPCLKGLDEKELASLPIKYIDGAHDRWEAPEVVSYL